jgi:lipopolysaccharide biosynthesis glycosyltransferase
MKNKSEQVSVLIYIMFSKNVTDKEKSEFLLLKNKYRNLEFVFLSIKEDDDSFYTGFIKSKASLYRLKLASLLSKENKCLYLDGDTIVSSDLFELFSKDINNYYIAAVRDLKLSKKAIIRPKLLKKVYFNTGVMLVNLSKIRKDNLEKKFHNLLMNNNKEKKLYFVDQDIINIACENKILPLHLKYNYMTHLLRIKVLSKIIYSKKNWDEAKKKPVITHYTFIQPWQKNALKSFYKKWWSYAKIVR